MNTSIIIPTLNRPKDMESTLISLLELKKYPQQTIIIDQSDNEETKHIIQDNKYKKLNILYLYSNIKSGALARNYGIENINQDSEIVIFLDDDVLLKKDFINKIEEFFNNNYTAKGGIANIKSPNRKITLSKKIGLFLLSGSFKQDEMYVTKGGFNVLPFINPQKLKNIERTSGCGMFFRKEIFDEDFRFEQQFMKYSLMEDCFLGYSIQEKYPNSLFFVPEVKMIHCETPSARIANKQRIYQNIIHRYYFVKKFQKSFFIYLRTMLIFCIFDTLQYKNIKVIKYYYKGLQFINQNRKKIGLKNFDFNNFIFGEE